MKSLMVVLVIAALTGCGTNKAMIASQANGPKEIFINMASDPLLISVELKSLLSEKGYDVSLSTEESGGVEWLANGEGGGLSRRVSDSSHRYEMTLSYRAIQDRFELIAASLRDRRSNQILGTYRWTWARLTPAPTVEGGIEMISDNLLDPVFE